MSVFLMLEAQEQAAAWQRRALAAEAMNRSQSERVSRLEEALKRAREIINATYVGMGMTDEGRSLNLAFIDTALNQGADDGR